MIYLDNGATSFPKAPGVAEAVGASLASLPGSAGRSSHSWSVEASRRLFAVREKLAAFLGLGSSEGLCFTKNATEALNLAILGYLKPGFRVLASSLEHNGVMRPLRHLEAQGRISLEILPLDAQGQPLGPKLQDLARGAFDFLAITGASNVTGVMPPVQELARLAHSGGAKVLVDASQLIGHAPCQPLSLGADLLAFPGHKGLLGPCGTGGLWIAPGLSLEPLLYGGTGSQSELEYQPDFFPDRYEAGTGNLAALEGLGAALDWLSAQNLGELWAKEYHSVGVLRAGLSELRGVQLVGPPAGQARSPILSVVTTDLAMDEVAQALDSRGIGIRMGLHCAPLAHKSLGTFTGGGSLRFSPGVFTKPEEIEACLLAMREILE